MATRNENYDGDSGIDVTTAKRKKESERAKRGKRRQSPSRESRIVDVVTQ